MTPQSFLFYQSNAIILVCTSMGTLLTVTALNSKKKDFDIEKKIMMHSKIKFKVENNVHNLYYWT